MKRTTQKHIFKMCANSIAIAFLTLHSVAYAQSLTADEVNACMKPLLSLQQDHVAQLNIDDQTSLMVYKSWQTDFKTKEEAKSKGIDLGVVFKALDLEGSYEEQESKYLREKHTLSVNYFNAQSRKRLSSLVTDMSNVAALKVIAATVDRCLISLGGATGRYCAVTATDSVVTVVLTEKYLPRMPRAKITNAKAILSNGSNKRSRQLFKKDTIVNPSGIMKTLERSPDESVTVEINTSNGTFHCDLVPAWPRYLVSGRIFGINETSVTNTTDVQLPTIPHRYCLGIIINWSGQACVPAGSTIKTIQLSPNTPLNPHSDPNYLHNGMACARPNVTGYTLHPQAQHCASVTYQVRECLDDIDLGGFGPVIRREGQACHYGNQHGTPVVAALTFETPMQTTLPEMRFSDHEIKGTSLELTYSHAASVTGKSNLDYEATITDMRNKKTVQLSRGMPTSGAFSSAITPANDKLLISVPNTP